MNYTKGKWELNNYRPNNGRIVLRTGSQDNDAFIGNREIAVASSCGKTHKEMKTNARLISAAPEMFEALEKILPFVEHHLPDFWPNPNDEPSELTKAKQALKKAKGE